MALGWDGLDVATFTGGPVPSAAGPSFSMRTASSGSLKASMCHQLAESFEADVSSPDASALNAGVY